MESRYAFNGDDRSRVFVQPDDDEDIWRFFPLERFLSLLEFRRLFFCRAHRFDDQWEGALPKLVQQAMQRADQNMSPKGRDDYRAGRVKARSIVAVSCWFMDLHESDAMWKLFVPSGEGVALKKELRAATVISDDAIKAAAAGVTDFEITDNGLLIPVDLSKLIDAIYVAPHAPASVATRVRVALDHAGLQSILLLPSRLGETPSY